MTKTQTAPTTLRRLTRDELLICRDLAEGASVAILDLIVADLTAAGLDPDTTDVLHSRNEEYLELQDQIADLNEVLDERN